MRTMVLRMIRGILGVSALALGACRNEPIQILEARRLAGSPAKVSPELAQRDPVALSIIIAPESLKQISTTDFVLYRCSSPMRLGVTELYLGDLQIGPSARPSAAPKGKLSERAAKGAVTLTAVAPRYWMDDEDYLCGHFQRDQLTDWFSDRKVSAVVRFPSTWRKPSTVHPDLLQTIARGCRIPEEAYSWRVEVDRISLMVEGADAASAKARGGCLVQGLQKAQVRAGYGTIVFSADS